MLTEPSTTTETKTEAEGGPAVGKFQLSNVGLKVVVRALPFANQLQ